MVTKTVNTVRVKATAKGFYGMLRKPGDIFNVTVAHKKASWYVSVDMLGNLVNPKADELVENTPDNPGEDGPDNSSEGGLDESDDLDLEDEDLAGE